MRGLLIASVLLVVVVLLLPPGAIVPISSATHAGAPRSPMPLSLATHGAAARNPNPAPEAALPRSIPISSFHAWNTTWAPSLARLPRPWSGVPSSAVLDTPPLPPATTTPTVLYLLNQSDGCCFEQNVSVPTGSWARVVLNFTGTAVGDVYDSSYRAFLGGVQVMFGTSPEYGTWTVDQDVTPYVSLLHGSVNVTFLFGEALLGGHFVVNLSLAFYPTAPGGLPPPEPNDIVPLWLSTAVTPTIPTLDVNATVPQNVTNATLELWAYGFNPDEFWYTTMPGFRSFDVSVDGTPIASVLPFPYINTGGINLFLWRPIPAVFTTSDRPYHFDATPLLGLLEGTHQYTASLAGISSGSRWILSGALLLNTSANESYGSSVSVHSYSSAPHITNSATAYDEETNASYSWASLLRAPDGAPTSVQGTWRDLFSSNVSLAGSVWENLSLHERTVESVNGTGPSGSWWENRTLNFTLDVDLGDVAVVTSTTDGGYPENVSFTNSFLNGLQSWQESDVSHTMPGGRSVLLATNVSNALEGANGVYSGTEKLTSPNAGQITSVSSINSLTPEAYNQTLTAGSLTGSYVRELTGSAVDPPYPNNQENITKNSFGGRLGAIAGVSSPEIDLGQNATFSVRTLGGVAPLQFVWGDLPVGCGSASTPTLVCHPSSSGLSFPNVTVTDAAGDHTTVLANALLVEKPLGVRGFRGALPTDAGATSSYNVSVTGGLGPYLCAWSVDQQVEAAPEPCAVPFNMTWTVPAPSNQTVTVVVTDGLDGTATTSWVQVVQPPPSVEILKVVANESRLVPGTAVQLTATAENGTGPYHYAWFIGASPASSGPEGPELNWTAAATGEYSFTVQITDAAGEENLSVPWVVSVLGPAPNSNSIGSSGGGSSNLDAWYALAAVVVVAVAMGAFVLTRRRPPRSDDSGPHAS
ncbi:MAG: hypothetical protein L3K03_07805 [Thermoplasmata archaeon]|nr:hypothetical protein [Thermoplasmata archaeon]